MGALLSLQFNLFVMIGVGFLIRKIHLIGSEGQKTLTDLVLYVVLPCNIAVSFLTDNSGGLYADCVVVLLISIGIQILSVIYGKFCFPKQHEDRRRNLAYAMICSNAGFLGIAVTESVFGSMGLVLTSIYLIPQRIMMWSEGLAIYSGVSDAKATAKKVLTHPCVIACGIGLVLMLTGFRPPELILTPVQTLARCNTPLSMMVIGMILGEIDLRNLIDKSIVEFTIHRLLLMPLVVYVVCRLLSVSAIVTGVSVLLAAMPAGATTTMLSAKYNRDPQYATKLVIFTTLCSIPAILIWSILLTA